MSNITYSATNLSNVELLFVEITYNYIKFSYWDIVKLCKFQENLVWSPGAGSLTMNNQNLGEY